MLGRPHLCEADIMPDFRRNNSSMYRRARFLQDASVSSRIMISPMMLSALRYPDGDGSLLPVPKNRMPVDLFDVHTGGAIGLIAPKNGFSASMDG